MRRNKLKQTVLKELKNILSEGTHPWYTSPEGYYKGTNPPLHPTGPRHTGNVIDYLKPGTLVYNAKGDSKTIKSLTDTHIMFTDGTKDYFMNWFPQNPLSEQTGTGDIGVGAGPISTPNWVMPKGEKTNPGTKAMQRLGFKKVVTELVKKELNSYKNKKYGK